MGRYDHLLTDTVTYAPQSGVSTQGDSSYGSQVAIAARVETDQGVVDSGTGKELVYMHLVYTATEVPVGSRVWLPGDNTGDNSAAKVVVSRKAASIPDGSDTLYELRV